MSEQLKELVKKYIELRDGEFETEEQEYEFNCLAHNIAEMLVDEIDEIQKSSYENSMSSYFDKYH